MYSPDRSFVKELKKYDSALGARWDDRRARWVIFRDNPDNTTWHVMTVQNNDGSYRPLDQRVFAHLYAHDLHRIGVDKFLENFDRLNEEAKKDLDSKRLEKIEEMADKYYNKLKRDSENLFGVGGHKLKDAKYNLDAKLDIEG